VADDRNPGYCEHSNLLWTCTKFVNVRQGEWLLASHEGLYSTELSFSVSLHTRLFQLLRNALT
jgi:hypothetical protein